MPYHRSSRFITGKLSFSLKKILLIAGEESYFVRLPRARHDYLHGDRVRARIVRPSDGAYLAEVEIVSLEARTTDILLCRIISQKGKKALQVQREFGHYETSFVRFPPQSSEGDIYLMRFTREGRPQILRKFTDESAFDAEEQILFFLSHIRLDFPQAVLREAEMVRDQGKYFFDTNNSSKKASLRRDFRDRFVFTIDGADAKDLDDAISIERDVEGNYLLWVHIADVAEYIREGSQLDREALDRATSVYTPWKVIPMLPEALSNDSCSLHPGAPKLVLSCLMTIGRDGMVRKTEIVEGIISSAYRGIYEEIEKREQETRGTTWGQTHLTHALDEAIALSYELYRILDRRRAREGKILFETTETYFAFESRGEWQHEQEKLVPSSIRKRERVDAHKLIEEFMVLANEEVAKWCDHRGIPFLSRVHGLPPQGAITAIREILRGNTVKHQTRFPRKHTEKSNTIEPLDIRQFLDSLLPEELYRYSRLLLPKMAKAVYADRKHRHFGLALEYYAHFTSPIRRYPDLQIHRIIKESIHGTLTPGRQAHYAKILRRVARHCSERERNAEDVERAFDALYACRYMESRIRQTFAGRVSGLAEFAYFVELENGIEVTVFLPRQRRFVVDPHQGILTTASGKKVVEIGELFDIKITDVLMTERRIVGERTGLSFWQSSSFS